MTANEMANELDEQLDRATSFGSPGYEDENYSSVLTEAMHVYIKQFIDKKNNRKNESFDETEIRGQGLSALIKRGATLTASASQTDVLTNGTFFDLPEDFMYCIHEEAFTNKVLCGPTEPEQPISFVEADIRVVGYDEVSRLKRNKYKKPFCESYGDALIWRLVYSREIDGYDPSIAATTKRHQLVTDGTFNVASYSINYLINPKDIIVNRDTPADQRNCTLDESTHRVIVDIAKSLMLERVKEQELTNVLSPKDIE